MIANGAVWEADEEAGAIHGKTSLFEHVKHLVEEDSALLRLRGLLINALIPFEQRQHIILSNYNLVDLLIRQIP